MLTTRWPSLIHQGHTAAAADAALASRRSRFVDNANHGMFLVGRWPVRGAWLGGYSLLPAQTMCVRMLAALGGGYGIILRVLICLACLGNGGRQCGAAHLPSCLTAQRYMHRCRVHWHADRCKPQSMAGNLWLAIYGWQSMAGNLWVAIYGWQSMAGNLWLAIYDWQSMAGNLWLAIYGCACSCICHRQQRLHAYQCVPVKGLIPACHGCIHAAGMQHVGVNVCSPLVLTYAAHWCSRMQPVGVYVCSPLVFTFSLSPPNAHGTDTISGHARQGTCDGHRPSTY